MHEWQGQRFDKEYDMVTRETKVLQPIPWDFLYIATKEQGHSLWPLS